MDPTWANRRLFLINRIPGSVQTQSAHSSLEKCAHGDPGACQIHTSSRTCARTHPHTHTRTPEGKTGFRIPMPHRSSQEARHLVFRQSRDCPSTPHGCRCSRAVQSARARGVRLGAGRSHPPSSPDPAADFPLATETCFRSPPSVSLRPRLSCGSTTGHTRGTERAPTDAFLTCALGMASAEEEEAQTGGRLPSEGEDVLLASEPQACLLPGLELPVASGHPRNENVRTSRVVTGAQEPQEASGEPPIT